MSNYILDVFPKFFGEFLDFFVIFIEFFKNESS